MLKIYNNNLPWRDPDDKFIEHLFIMYSSQNIYMFFVICDVFNKNDVI